MVPPKNLIIIIIIIKFIIEIIIIVDDDDLEMADEEEEEEQASSLALLPLLHLQHHDIHHHYLNDDDDLNEEVDVKGGERKGKNRVFSPFPLHYPTTLVFFSSLLFLPSPSPSLFYSLIPQFQKTVGFLAALSGENFEILNLSQ